MATIEAVCCAQVVQASEHKSRQKLRSVHCQARAWSCCKATDENVLWSFALHHHHLCRHTIRGFCKKPHYAFVMPCVPRTLHSFGQSFLLPSVIALASQLVLARHQAGRNILRGESGGRPVPIVRARLVPRQLPPQPPYAGSGAQVLTVHC